MYGNFTVFTTRKTLDFPKMFCLIQVIVPVVPSATLSVACTVCIHTTKVWGPIKTKHDP